MANFFGGVQDAVTSPLNLISPGGGFLGQAYNGVQGMFNTPAYQQPTMDPNGQKQVTQSGNALLQNPDQQKENLLSGTGAAGSVADTSAGQANESKELGGGGMPGMQAAINNKAAKNFATSQGRLSQQAQLEGMQMSNHNVAMATQNAMALQNAQLGVNQQVNQYTLAANAATYNTISSIMSGAGKLGGAYAGSKSASGQQDLNNGDYFNQSMNESQNEAPFAPMNDGSYQGDYSGFA